MSTQITIKRLDVAEMKSCPVMQLWAMSELNQLAFQPGSSVNDCWVHQCLAAFMFGKQTLKTARNGILKGIRRHPLDGALVLYGDLHRAQAEIAIDDEQDAK